MSIAEAKKSHAGLNGRSDSKEKRKSEGKFCG